MEAPKRTAALVAGLAIAVGLSSPDPAAAAEKGAGPRIKSVDVDASPFGAVVTVQLRDRLTRVVRNRAGRLAGVGIVLAHDSGRPAVVALNVARSAIETRARRGTEGPVPVFMVGKSVTFYIPDSRIADVEEVLVATYTGVRRTRTLARRARIGVQSAEGLLEDVAFVGIDSADGPEEDYRVLLAQLARRQTDQGELTSCDQLRRQVQRARDVLNDPPTSPSRPHAKAISGAVKRLERWFRDARAKLVALCDQPGSPAPGNPGGGAPGGGAPGGGNPGGGNPGGGPANQAPTATFTPSLSNPKAAETVQFDGSASSDPDGTLTSHAWTFGDAIPSTPGAPSPGSPSAPTASGTTAAASFSGPGRYPVTLTVTDNAGGTAFMTRTIFVSGPGSKTDTATFDAASGGCAGMIKGFVEIYIPTYAEQTFHSLVKLGGCANATLTVTKVTRTFNTAPPDPVTGKPRLDAWGQVEDTYRIEFTIAGGTAAAGSVQTTVTWK
jgi:hypothetical protein